MYPLGGGNKVTEGPRGGRHLGGRGVPGEPAQCSWPAAAGPQHGQPTQLQDWVRRLGCRHAVAKKSQNGHLDSKN